MSQNQKAIVIGRALSIAGWCAALLMTVLWMRERHFALLEQRRAVERAAAERSASAAASAIRAPDLTTDSSARETQDPGAATSGSAPQDTGTAASGLPTRKAELGDTEAQVLELRRDLRRQAQRAEDVEGRAQAHDELRESIVGAFRSAEGMAGQQMEMSLANFAGDLTREDRGVVRDALVNAMSSGSWRPQEGMAGMYGAARETLAGSLGEQQLAIYDRYVQQQLALMKMATAVMDQATESE